MKRILLIGSTSIWMGLSLLSALYSRPKNPVPVATPGRRFTKPYTNPGYPNDTITSDTRTDVIWKTCPEGQSGSDCRGTGDKFNYFGAGVFDRESAKKACLALSKQNDGKGYGGYTDWRLPPVEALLSFVDYGQTHPAVDRAAFPMNAPDIYWSSSSRVDDPANTTWGVDLGGGYSFGVSHTLSIFARCVAGPVEQLALRSFVASETTVLDTNTHLTWQRCSSGQASLALCKGKGTKFTMAKAVAYCRDLTLGGPLTGDSPQSKS